MQQRLDKPSAHYVSYHAGTTICLPNVTEEDMLDNHNLLSSVPGVCPIIDRVVDVSRPAYWQPLPGDEGKGCEFINYKDYTTVPSMPISSLPLSLEHRDFIPIFDFPFDLLIAEPVTRAQRRQLPKAQAACDLEWNKLLARGTWDSASVTEWKETARRFQKSGEKVHVAHKMRYVWSKVPSSQTMTRTRSSRDARFSTVAG